MTFEEVSYLLRELKRAGKGAKKPHKVRKFPFLVIWTYIDLSA
jgi:hypothetical protein